MQYNKKDVTHIKMTEKATKSLTANFTLNFLALNMAQISRNANLYLYSLGPYLKEESSYSESTIFTLRVGRLYL